MRKVLVLVLFVLLTAGMAYGASSFVYEYTQDAGDRIRGMAIMAEDDAFVGINYAPRSAQWYFDMPDTVGAYDCEKLTFVLDSLNYTYSYNWGAGFHDNLIYHAVQDVGALDSYILVWDLLCQEVDYLYTGVNPSGTEYPTACDCDAAGNVYMALYIDGASMDQITIYPPRASWVGHTAAPIQSLETGAYVCEGMCVNQAGTVIWTTNRSATGSKGSCWRFTGSVAGGFTKDMSFHFDGDLDVDGYVRAVEVDETNDRIFIASDNNGVVSGGEYILIAGATTGAKYDTLWCLTEGSEHNSPYDLEWDETGQDLYVQHYYGWFVDKYHWPGGPVPVTMSSFTAQAGQDMVELSWRVESEVENRGFNLYRDDQIIAFVDSRGATDAPRTYTWIDKDVVAGVTYTYTIADVELDGRVNMHDFSATATPLAAGVPTTYWLSQNYPNPFNADTHIEFTLAKAGNTTLKIYNNTGQLVRTLVDEHMAASHHKVRWDGRSESGELVASGVYFYRLASGAFAETKKMTFLR